MFVGSRKRDAGCGICSTMDIVGEKREKKKKNKSREREEKKEKGETKVRKRHSAGVNDLKYHLCAI